MQLSEDPVHRLIDFEDRFAEFTRFTLQGEQDFHVGLRSDLDREYQRYGVSVSGPVTFKSHNHMDQEKHKMVVCDGAPLEASKIVSSVLGRVNNKVTSGEITLVNDNEGTSFKSGTEEPVSGTPIPELEEAIKSISARIERILSPPKERNKEELLEEIKTKINEETKKLQNMNRQASLVGGNVHENSGHPAANQPPQEPVEKARSEHMFITEIFEKSESLNSSPQSGGNKEQDSEHFNFEEIIRKKTGRGLQESVHLDVETEKEWELETENMPMEIATSPDTHNLYNVKKKEMKENGPVSHHLTIEDADAENNNGSSRIAAISDDKKSAEVLEGEIAVLQKEVKWLEEEIKALKGTVVERNARLAESHQLRRNLEEELSLMHRK
ncbi:uncharacterized protein LOC134821681 [Bolinopsis microptera]|uniref:uncharacterized protein LOC134821681 n=1 Tax=Bolinopsis microptera TaxID=2820187 RepID=UPI003078F2B3